MTTDSRATVRAMSPDELQHLDDSIARLDKLREQRRDRRQQQVALTFQDRRVRDRRAGPREDMEE